MATATGTGTGMGTRTQNENPEEGVPRGLSLVLGLPTSLLSFFAVGLNYLRFSLVFRVHRSHITPGQVLG